MPRNADLIKRLLIKLIGYKTLASGSWDEFIRFWDVETGEPLRAIAGHVERVTGVLYSPDGETLVSFGRDEKIHVWDSETGEFLKTLKPEFESAPWGSEYIYAIAFFFGQ